jgi:hypothetical protein
LDYRISDGAGEIDHGARQMIDGTTPINDLSAPIGHLSAPVDHRVRPMRHPGVADVGLKSDLQRHPAHPATKRTTPAL